MNAKVREIAEKITQHFVPEDDYEGADSEIAAIIAEALAAQEAEIARLRDLIADSRYFVAEHARKNPKWEYEGRIQDPDGVHALLLKINADLLPPDEKKEEPCAKCQYVNTPQCISPNCGPPAWEGFQCNDDEKKEEPK